MTGGTEFTFKPALLRAPVRHALTQAALILHDSDGAQVDRLAWEAITGGAFVEMRAQGAFRMRRLDLFHPGGTLSLSCTAPDGDLSPGTDAGKHWALMIAVLERLATEDRGIRFNIGEYGRGRVAMFGVGLFSALTAVGLGIVMLATGVSVDKMTGAALPLVLMLGFGGVLMSKHAPWRPPPAFEAGALAQVLAAMLAPDAGQGGGPEHGPEHGPEDGPEHGPEHGPGDG